MTIDDLTDRLQAAYKRKSEAAAQLDFLTVSDVQREIDTIVREIRDMHVEADRQRRDAITARGRLRQEYEDSDERKMNRDA